MQLNKKKELAARALSLGKERIIFNKERLEEIKEAITKQDMRDLLKNGAISTLPIKGKLTKPKRKTRRREGSIKKKVNHRKRDYIIITRKLRGFISELRKKEIIAQPEYKKLRNEIRAKNFRSKSHMKDRVNQLIKEREEK